MSYFYVTDARRRGLFVDPTPSSTKPPLHIIDIIGIEESAGGVEDKTGRTLCKQNFVQGYYLDENEFPDPKKVERLRERLCPACVNRLDRTSNTWQLLLKLL